MFTLTFFALSAVVLLGAVALPVTVNRVPKPSVTRRAAWDEDEPPATIR